MANKNLTQGIECIDSILGSDNSGLISALDKYLNPQGLSIKDTCELIEFINSADSLINLPFLSSMNLNGVDISKYSISDKASAIFENSKNMLLDSVKLNMNNIGSIDILSQNFENSLQQIKDKGNAVQSIFAGVGLNTINGDDVMSDVADEIKNSEVGVYVSEAAASVKSVFKDVSDFATSVIDSTKGNQPDNNKENSLEQSFISAIPGNLTNLMNSEILKIFCETYSFLGPNLIDLYTNDLKAALANDLRLNVDLSIIKNPCMNLIEDIMSNGFPDDICGMNQYYTEKQTLFTKNFTNNLIYDIGKEIDKISVKIKDIVVDLDSAWLDINLSVNPCDKNDTGYNKKKVENLNISNNACFDLYNDLHIYYNNLIIQINTPIASTTDSNGNLKVQKPLELSINEKLYLNNRLNSSKEDLERYLNIINDISLSEEIKSYDLLCKDKVFFKIKEFNILSNEKYNLQSQSDITGKCYNYSNVSPVVKKCNEF